MDRREALALTTALLGTTLVGSQVFLSACRPEPKEAGPLTSADVPLLNALADTILPDTAAAPGAGKAGVGAFIRSLVSECYSREEEREFVRGLRAMESRIASENPAGFTELDAAARTEILTRLDTEARNRRPDSGTHFFEMLLQLSVWGYFISEPGATQALRYNPTPGRFEGCVPYSPGDKAWA